MSKPKKNWARRLRKIRAKARKLGQNEDLLDLTPLDDQEKKTFLELVPKLSSFEEIMKAIQESFEGDDYNLKKLAVILNGLNPWSKMPWPKYKEGQIVGLRGDILITDDLVNYPLTESPEIDSFFQKEIDNASRNH